MLLLEIFKDKYHYIFKNNKLIEQAFTFNSYVNEHNNENLINNQILEFIGDKVLGIVVIDWLSDYFGQYIDNQYQNEYKESFLTKFEEQIVKKDTLATVCSYHHFEEYMKIGKGDNKNNITIKECLIESIIGAVYLDSNKDKTVITDFINSIFKDKYSFENIVAEFMNTNEIKVEKYYFKQYNQLVPFVYEDKKYKVTLKDIKLVDETKNKIYDQLMEIFNIV